MSTGQKKGGSQQPAKSQQAASPPPSGPSRMVRALASLALAFHVFVLFLYPLANTRTSDTVRRIAQSPWMRWYADPLYLNHGHNFFAPDPGASFIVNYEVRDANQQVVAEGKFPDAERIWPRLRYHRYKMLADQMNTPVPAAPNHRNEMLERYARQLLRQHDGESAALTYEVHQIVPYFEWLGDPKQGVKGKDLNDRSLYREELRVQQYRSDVEAADAKLLGDAEAAPGPIAPPESIPGGRPQ